MRAINLAVFLTVLASQQLWAAETGTFVGLGENSGAGTSTPPSKAVLADTVKLVTSENTGVGGADESLVQTGLGMSTLGFRIENELGDNRIADDFTIPAGEAWDIQNIVLFSHEYVGPQVKNSALTTAHLRIWDGPPNVFGSNVIWGDLTTNVLVSSEWTGIYRLLDTDSGQDDTRGIMANVCQVGTTLGGGTYWFEWRAEASFAYDGPYAPPITEVGKTSTGNGLWYWSGQWQDAVDVGQQGFPYAIEGTIITIEIPAPDETQVQDSNQTQTLFLCQDQSRPALPENEDYFPTWRHVIWGQDEVEGYHHQLFEGSSCTGLPSVDSVWELNPGASYYSFQIPSAAAGPYCWQARAWLTDPWSGTGGNIYGDWSACCCFDVGIDPDFSISDTTPLIGQEVVFPITGISGDIDKATWSLGGAGCNGASSTQVCTASQSNDCKSLVFSYASAGSKTVTVSVEVDGTTYPGPQKTISVQNAGECPAGQCLVLSTPNITEVGGTACGGTTPDTEPLLFWEDVANDSGYRWEVRDAAGILVAGDTSAPNVSVAAIGTVSFGDYVARVQARGDGQDYCDSEWAPECPFIVASDIEDSIDFTWWPEVPKQGERVRFADLSTGTLESWLWEFGDGGTSNEQHPTYVFNTTGDFTTVLDVGFASGDLTLGKTINVAGAVSCGNDVCESGETAWSCASDCALEPDQTGRAGGSDRRPTVPAAAGAVPGLNNTLWNTEGTIFNPGPDAVKVIVEYTPTGLTEVQQAGPFDLPAQRSLYWSNMVQELFKSAGSGALWIDATGPVLVMTRTYTAETSTKVGSGQGTYGQGFSGARERFTIARGDDAVYLIGLRDDEEFRTNLYFQEVDGLAVKVKVTLFSDSGEMVGERVVSIEGHSVKLKNLGSLFQTEVDSGYITAEVTGGSGRIAAAGSVIDEITGDPTSIVGVHPNQVSTKAGSDLHDLVAAVVHTKGILDSVWRSKLTIQNPSTNPAQNARLVYRPEYDRTGAIGSEIQTTVNLQPGQQVSVDDVLPDLFGVPESVKTQGSLHVHSTDGLLIDSRTYNERASGGTLGLGIPALQDRDLVSNDGKHGKMIGLQHSNATRTNVGLAEYSGEDTVVELSFSTTLLEGFHLGTLTREVPANSHVQLLKVFEKLPDLEGLELDGLKVEVVVKSGGSIYAYATLIDNASGDPTSFLAVTD